MPPAPPNRLNETWQKTTIYGGTGTDHMNAMVDDANHNTRTTNRLGHCDRISQPLQLLCCAVFCFYCACKRRMKHKAGESVDGMLGYECFYDHCTNSGCDNCCGACYADLDRNYRAIGYADPPTYGSGYSKEMLDTMTVWCTPLSIAAVIGFGVAVGTGAIASSPAATPAPAYMA